MAKDKKKSKVSFQFTALQKRIKLLNAKVTLLTEENRRLQAEARKEWRHSASKELVAQVEKDLFAEQQPNMLGLSEQLPPKKSWYKRILGL